MVREDEEEGSDEERINMGTGVESNDLSTRREQYFEDIDDGGDPEAAAENWPIPEPVSSLLPPPPPPVTLTTKELTSPELLTKRLKDR